jgi:hypothetical protein
VKRDEHGKMTRRGDACQLKTLRALNNSKRFVARADEKLTVFLELKSAIRACGDCA